MDKMRGQEAGGRGQGKKKMQGVAFLALCIVILTGLQYARAQKNKGVFSLYNANAVLTFIKKQCAFGARVPGTKAHKNTKTFLESELKKYADVVATEKFGEGYTNIIGEFGMMKQKKILLCAHWDSRKFADREKDSKKKKMPVPGANDGASGVAVLLELAKIFKNHPPKNGITIAFFDAEDQGHIDGKEFCLGAKHFAKKRKKQFKNYQYGILLDMVCAKNASFYVEENSVASARDVVDNVWNAGHALGFPQFKSAMKFSIYDDHIPLIENGLPSVDIIDFTYKHWHTTQDTPDKCDVKTLNAVGKTLLKVLYP